MSPAIFPFHRCRKFRLQHGVCHHSVRYFRHLHEKTLHQNLLCDYCHVCHICLVHFRHPRCIVCPHRRNHIVNFSQQKHQTYGSYSLLRIVFYVFSPIPISVKATLPSGVCVQLSDRQKMPHTLSAKKIKKLAEYLKYKPFGEGLGLGGVEARKYGSRLTTLIPHDSFMSRHGWKPVL